MATSDPPTTAPGDAVSGTSASYTGMRLDATALKRAVYAQIGSER